MMHQSFTVHTDGNLHYVHAYPDVCDVKIVLFPRTGGSCKGKKFETHKNIYK